jgi:2-dehydro-3-deoxyphosphogluconate aldolase / (4S)-4-hydroxy-2-oxoglutarate aldolase
VKKEEVRARIEEIGIIPAIRVSSSEEAHFAAASVNRAGIPIAEITATVPGVVEVIARLMKECPKMIVGAGTVMDTDLASRCLDAGACFLTSPGLALEVVEFAAKKGVAVFPGALTPTEVHSAWKAGADMVKVFPCAQVGGANYIRALKAPFPQVPLIASGGVNQQTALQHLLAGASALGIGAELIPKAAVRLRQEEQIHELARRFKKMVKDARGRHLSK